MTERERLRRVLDIVGPSLPEGRYFINGSGALYLNGIDNGRPMGDLDVFMATADWFDHYRTGGKLYTLMLPERDSPEERADPPYLIREVLGLPVHLFFDWRVRHVADIDVNWLIHNAEIVDGYACAPLQAIVDWKAQKLRAKDAQDLEAIRRQRPDLFKEGRAA